MGVNYCACGRPAQRVRPFGRGGGGVSGRPAKSGQRQQWRRLRRQDAKRTCAVTGGEGKAACSSPLSLSLSRTFSLSLSTFASVRALSSCFGCANEDALRKPLSACASHPTVQMPPTNDNTPLLDSHLVLHRLRHSEGSHRRAAAPAAPGCPVLALPRDGLSIGEKTLGYSLKGLKGLKG